MVVPVLVLLFIVDFTVTVVKQGFAILPIYNYVIVARVICLDLCHYCL